MQHAQSCLSEGCAVNKHAYNPVQRSKTRLVHSYGEHTDKTGLDISFVKYKAAKKNKRAAA